MLSTHAVRLTDSSREWKAPARSPEWAARIVVGMREN